MTIQLKGTCKRYLFIGISILIVCLASCNQDTEYGVTMDLVFENVTTSSIRFNIKPSVSSINRQTVILAPQSRSNIFTYKFEGVDKNLNIETCCQDFLIDVYGGRGTEGDSQILALDNDLCVTHLNEKSVDLSNYAKEKVNDSHFRYRYTFDSIDIEDPQQCQ